MKISPRNPYKYRRRRSVLRRMPRNPALRSGEFLFAVCNFPAGYSFIDWRNGRRNILREGFVPKGDKIAIAMKKPRYKSIIGCFCISDNRFRAKTRFTNFRFIISAIWIFTSKSSRLLKRLLFALFTPQYAEFQLYYYVLVYGSVHSPVSSSELVTISLFSKYIIVNKGLFRFSFILQNLLELSFFGF